MPIKNYTTRIPSFQSLAEIQGMLAQHGANKIMLEYDKQGKAIGVAFAVDSGGFQNSFYLTADIDGVLAAFKRQRVRADKEQAERTAWRNIRDWIAAQMAFIECGNAKVEELFFPYLTDGKTTLYKAYSSGLLQLPEYATISTTESAET